MENQKQEALDVAGQLENGFITLGKTARALRYEAAETIRRLHARIQELEAKLESVGAGGVSAQRVTQGKDHIVQDSNMVAAPVVLPEPDSYLFQHEDTGQTMFVEAQQVEWGFETNNPRLHKVSGVYIEQQVRELLAKDIDPVNLDRLGKALTKLGHAKWVSQAEAAADIPRWVNALTSCVLEIPEAAPQPQADLISMQQCVSCGHMYHAPAPYQCDCLENTEGKYLDFVAISAPQPQADGRDNLLAALENLLASITGGQKQCGHDFDCVCPEDQARAAIAAEKEQK